MIFDKDTVSCMIYRDNTWPDPDLYALQVFLFPLTFTIYIYKLVYKAESVI